MRNTIFLLILMLGGNAINAQDPSEIVLFTVDGEAVTVDEFTYIYEKNNSIARDSNLYSQESVRDYLDLYIKFKLKVKEAETQGLDTTQKFIEEFKTYRDQLAEPYLTDRSVSEKLVKQAYERMKTEVRARHILIQLDEDAFPADTMAAWKKAMEAKKLVAQGKPFEEVARTYSEDPSVSSNGGDLGYFTVFNMIYPFENASYNGEIGELVGPVRTRFGYHIIEVTDKRDYRGEVTVSHIMIRTDLAKDSAELEIARKKIDSIYARLDKGEDFADMARTESQHYSSAGNGGRLRPITSFSTWLPDKMKEVAFSLEEDGAISKPFKTEFGWHILKRIETEGLPEFENTKEQLKRKVERDTRSQLSKEAAIERIKEENRFKSWERRLKDFKEEKDSSLLKGKWKMHPDESYKKKVMRIGKEKYTQKDFAQFLINNQAAGKFQNLDFAVDYYFDRFVDEKVIAYEDKNLIHKYRDFRNIVKEYREGILLFEITDQEVWSKAMKDTLGQKEFYEEHKEDFMWKERADVFIFYCKDKETADKIEEGLKEDNSNVDELFKELNKNNSMTFSFSKDIFERGQSELLAEVEWEEGFARLPDYKGRYVLIKFNEVLPPQPKEFEKIKGLVIAAYQDHLEKEWVESLREKYELKVDEQAVENLFK